jgi:hypothetical protein
MENCATISCTRWTDKECAGRLEISESSDHGMVSRCTCLYIISHHDIKGLWTCHEAVNIGRLRFQAEAHSCDTPHQDSHVVDLCDHVRYMEIVGKHNIKKTQTSVIEHVIEYTSGIGDRFHTLPRHIQILVGNISEIEVSNKMDVIEEQDIIVATYRSVVFGVGYHRWVVTTDNEQVILMDGGPYDGYQLLMVSYRSELGGIASELAVISTLVRFGKIRVKSVKLVCNNEAAIKAFKRKHTTSVFQITEVDHDLISTIHYLK